MTVGRIFITIFCICLISSWSYGQQKLNAESKTAKVFYIGDDEKSYERLVERYNTMLFTVCNNNMELAFDHWSSLLKDIEDYANISGLDLKGVKLWLNVFWAKDGTVDHIVFYPKPNSKNMNYDNVKLMLNNFTSTYQATLKSSTSFSHYGSASFPIFSKAIIGPEK
ncbi:MAG: hypothetical protein IPN86_09055 [Saprospiraceae bacterium]|jgi:hypothetical protein|nr:hypothetical protein [Saprospiraceae bacterium]